MVAIVTLHSCLSCRSLLLQGIFEVDLPPYSSFLYHHSAILQIRCIFIAWLPIPFRNTVVILLIMANLISSLPLQLAIKVLQGIEALYLVGKRTQQSLILVGVSLAWVEGL